VSIDLREIRLIHRPSAYILRLNTARVSKLMLDSQTPFHKVRGMKLAFRNRRDGDRGQTCRRACERRCAGKLALREASIEPLIRRDGCIDRAVGRSGRYGRAAHGSQQPALEGLNVWRIHSDQVGNTPGQDIAENAEAGSKNGVGFELPSDGGPGLQNRQRRRYEEISETSLNRVAQRLIDIMRDGI